MTCRAVRRSSRLLLAKTLFAQQSFTAPKAPSLSPVLFVPSVPAQFGGMKISSNEPNLHPMSIAIFPRRPDQKIILSIFFFRIDLSPKVIKFGFYIVRFHKSTENHCLREFSVTSPTASPPPTNLPLISTVVKDTLGDNN